MQGVWFPGTMILMGVVSSQGSGVRGRQVVRSQELGFREKHISIGGGLINIKSIVRIAIIISLFLMLLPVSPSAEDIKISQTSHVVINEVCWNVTNPMAWWFELYNPTSEPINVTHWWIWFLSVDGPIDLATTLILPPDGYAVICRNKDNFTRYWEVSEDIEIVETSYEGWGCINDSFWIDNGDEIVDMVEEHFTFLPTIHLNHSWARYKGGYDTDNFTDDFYDEPTPTPGYENTISRKWPVWTNDRRLSDNDGYCSDKPAIAVNGNNIYVVWTDNRDGCWEIYYKISHDNGETWGNDTRLTDNDGKDSLHASIAVCENNVHVAWWDRRNDWPEIYYKNSNDGGDNWSDDIQLTDGEGESEFPKIAVDGEKVHVVWNEAKYIDGSMMPDEVYYMRSDDNGESWGAEVMLSKNDSIISFNQDIVAAGGTIHVVWNDYTTTKKHVIYYRRSIDYGATWEEPMLLVDTNGSVKSADGPRVAAKDNNIYVVWCGWLGGPHYEIYLKNSSDGGVAWSEDVRLTYNESLSISPDIAVDEYNIHVIWYDHRHDPNMSDFDYVCEIYYKYSNNKGLTWSDDIRITYNESCAWSPKIAVNNCGGIYLVWQDDRDGMWEIYYMRSIQNPPSIDYYYPFNEPIINETESITFNIIAVDPNDNNLSYSWYLNDALLPEETSSFYTFISNYDSSGVYKIKVAVIDDGFPSLSASYIWNLTVLNKNRKPMLESINDQMAYEGQLFTLQINGSDSDNDIIMFLDNTTLFDINSTTGLISFIPSYESAGTYYINITVTDGEDLTWQTFRLTIINVNRKPTAIISSPQNNSKFTTNDNINFDATGSYDPDNDNLIYTWTSSIDGNIGNAKSFSRKLSQGTHTIALTVSDGTAEDYKQIIVTVEKPASQQGGGFIHGFEVASLIAMIGICVILLRKRKHRTSHKLKRLVENIKSR